MSIDILRRERKWASVTNGSRNGQDLFTNSASVYDIHPVNAAVDCVLLRSLFRDFKLIPNALFLLCCICGRTAVFLFIYFFNLFIFFVRY